jgi:hypothetical protein
MPCFCTIPVFMVERSLDKVLMFKMPFGFAAEIQGRRAEYADRMEIQG